MGFTSNPSYYRLKQIDKDGKFSYSNIVVLRNTNVGNDFVAIYPNPVTNILNVKIVSSANNQVKLLVTDVSGKLLQNKTTRVGNAETIVQLDVSNLPSGTYFLKIICDEGCENGVKKFVKE